MSNPSRAKSRSVPFGRLSAIFLLLLIPSVQATEESVLEEFDTSFLGSFTATVELENSAATEARGSIVLRFREESATLQETPAAFRIAPNAKQTVTVSAQAPILAWGGEVVLEGEKGSVLPEVVSIDVKSAPLASVNDIPAAAEGKISDSAWNAKWIVFPGEEPGALDETATKNLANATRYFWKILDIPPDLKEGTIVFTADDSANVWVNGQLISSVSEWQRPARARITNQLRPGRNILAVEVRNLVAAYGLVAEIRLVSEGGKETRLGTGAGWLASEREPENWPKPEGEGTPVGLVGDVGCTPWGFLRRPDWDAPRQEVLQETLPPLEASCALPAVSIASKSGAPAVRVGNHTQAMMMVQQIQGGTRMQEQERLGRHGIDSIIVDIGDFGWKADSTYDYSLVDQLVRDVLDANPKAWITLSFMMTPDWWMARHPEAAALGPDGTPSLEAYHGTKGRFPCFVHPLWRQDVGNAVRQLVRHVGASSYASRIIGFKPNNGISAEWMYWGAQSRHFSDFNPAMQKAFRDWVKKERLGGFPAEIPRPEAWRENSGFFLNPVSDAQLIAYARFFQEMVSGTVDWIAGILKEESLGRSLVGVYYGYNLAFPEGEHISLFSGHFGLSRLLEGKNLDLLYSPSSYSFRKVGEPGAMMVPAGSIRLHDKLFVSEADYRTHWSSQEVARTKTIRETIDIMRREFASSLASGFEIEWYDFSINYQTGDERIVSEWGKLQKLRNSLGPDALDFSSGDMAIIVGEDISMQNPLSPPLPGGVLLYHQMPQFSLAGVRHHYFLQTDLANPVMKTFPMLVLLNCWNLSPAQLEAIQQLKSGGRTLMFVYAPGAWNPQSGMDVRRLESLTGLSFAEARTDLPLRIQWKNPDTTFGLSNDKTASIAFFPKPGEGDEVLGTSVADGSPLALRRQFPDWTSIYVGAPLLPARVIQNLADAAGVHIWSRSSDAVYPSNETVGFHATSVGRKQIRLPFTASRVTNWLTGEVVAENAQEFSFGARPKRTYIFHYAK